MGLIPALIHREEVRTIVYEPRCVLVKLWREEPMLGSYLLAAHSRHLPSLGCKFVAPLSQAPSSPWSLQQEPSISLRFLTQLAGVTFQVSRCLIISLDLIPKKLNSDLRMLYSVIFKTPQGSPAFLLPLSFCYRFMSSAALCIGGL